MVTKLKIAIIAVVAIAAIVGITLGIVYGTRSDDDDTPCERFNAPILELTVIDDRLLASWTEPDNLNDCSVTYNLKYTIDGGTEVSKELEETQFKFDDLELEPCTEVNVILTAVNKHGHSSNPARETFTKEVDTGFAGVLGLTITFTGEFDILATWVRLTGFEKCDLKYQVIVGKVTTIVDGTELAATLGYCTTTISIAPVIEDVVGILKSEDVTIAVEEGFVSIYGMEAERFDVFLEAIWQRLPAFDACPINFRVTLNDAEQQETTRLEVRFDLPDETCVDHTIKVTPMVGEISGSPLSETVHIGVLNPDFGAVSELTITVIQGNQVSVKWVGPIGFEECTMKYKVTVGEDDPTIVDELEYTGTVKYCTTTIISVVPVIGDVHGTPEEQGVTPTEVLEGFAGIEDWSITHTHDNQVLVKWAPPKGFDKCSNLLYKVSIVGGLVITLEDHEYTAILVYCHPTTIHLVPVIDGVEGIRAENTGITVNVAEGFADVSYLRITPIEGKYVLVTWYRPINYSECTMKYKVTVDGGTSAMVDEPEYITSLDYCVPKIIEVVPVIDEVYGLPMVESTAGIYPESIGQVSALTTEYQGNIFKATWSKPSDFERCTLRYIVELKQGSNTIASSTIEDTIEWTYDVGGYCPGEAMEFTIKASYSYLLGELTSVTQVCSD